MTSSTAPGKRQGESADYLAARESWLKRVMADRGLRPRAKLVASALYFYFNTEEFIKDGELFAWPSTGVLGKHSGLSKKRVKAAIDDLEAAGYLYARRRYDPIRKQSK